MGKILAFIQLDDGQPNRNALEALQGGQQLAADMGHQLIGVVFSASSPQQLQFQMDEIITVAAPELELYSADTYVAAMAQIIAAEQPDLLIAGHTYQARDWLPRLAAQISRPLISDCIGFQNGAQITWVRQVFQGKVHADVTTGEGLAIVSFQAGAFRHDRLEPGSPAIRSQEVDLSAVEVQVRAGEPFQDTKAAVDLSRAERIVAVGRGIGDEEKLALVRELAEALGAELGSSRPVVDYGWLSHDRQVGSSGQTVAAKL
ncbi:MAG: electron transfer flavoprotein subunit alpha/FixB family protein, partial [Candidatus Marinimicrobia bacterium]|nr:electron transfer flavoprotein subunit alpha/FixB family protein [Candidatus Neomarinimicrobiota bacterium]